MKQTITLLAFLFTTVFGAKAATYTFTTGSTFETQVNARISHATSPLASGDTIILPSSGPISLGAGNNTTVNLTAFSNLVIISNNTFTINGSNSELLLSGTSLIVLPTSVTSLVTNGNTNTKLVIGGNTIRSGNTTTAGPGRFYVGGFVNSTVTPLPVSLLSFNATATANSVNLSFEVAMESNIAYYEVERSTDGSNFSKTGIIATANNTDAKFTYTLTDLNPAAGTNYYRLVINSTDGKETKSNIASAKIKAAASFEPAIFPNPATSSINITTNNAAIDYSVLDMSGRIVIAGSFTVDATKKLDITSLNKGNYILSMNSNGQTKAVSFVKIAD